MKRVQNVLGFSGTVTSLFFMPLNTSSLYSHKHGLELQSKALYDSIVWPAVHLLASSHFPSPPAAIINYLDLFQHIRCETSSASASYFCYFCTERVNGRRL
jgi:hypothetical protein